MTICALMRAIVLKGRAIAPDVRTMAAVCVGLIGLIGVLYIQAVYFAIGPTIVLWFYNVTATFVAVVIVGLTVAIWWASEPGELLKTISGYLASGLVLWSLGQAASAFAQVTQSRDLVGPSLADVFWLAGYAPIIVGLGLRYRTFRLKLSAARWLTILSAYAVLVALAVGFVVRPILEHPNPAQPAMLVINLMYIFADLVIVLVAALIMQSLARGAMFAPWAVVAAGCLMIAVSDLLFTYGTWSGTYLSDPLVAITPLMYAYNVAYFSAYAISAIGVYWLARLHRVI